MSTDRLEEIYAKQLANTYKLVEEYKPMQVAAILMAQALSIYRTSLNEEEFNSMVDVISETRDQVKPFEKVVLQ